MAGIFSQGGAIDHLFDPLRSAQGAADTAVQEFLTDKFRQDSERYAVQRVLWVYEQGIKKGAIKPFTGTDDTNADQTVAYIQSGVQLNRDLIFYILFALQALASKGDADCAKVLAGEGGNFFDDLINGGPVAAATNTINATLSGLGFPSLANTVVVLAVLAIIGGIVYLKVKK